MLSTTLEVRDKNDEDREVYVLFKASPSPFPDRPDVDIKSVTDTETDEEVSDLMTSDAWDYIMEDCEDRAEQEPEAQRADRADEYVKRMKGE
jgi:hypothetical protein